MSKQNKKYEKPLIFDVGKLVNSSGQVSPMGYCHDGPNPSGSGDWCKGGVVAGDGGCDYGMVAGSGTCTPGSQYGAATDTCFSGDSAATVCQPGGTAGQCTGGSSVTS